jgi:phage gp16-like protein
MTLTPERRKLTSAYHAACAKAGLDEADRRDMLETQTGKRSSKDCSDAQLRRVLAHLNGSSTDKPFKPSKRADVRKIHAQWGELKRQGKLTSPTKAALRAFCANMAKTGAATTDPEFLTSAQARMVVEALKKWIERKSSDEQAG